jgi:FkbM family methyltransferase
LRLDVKGWLKSLLRHTPYRIIRARDPNRFQAIEETLTSLRSRGFSPNIVLDGGANVGDFARLVRRIFGQTAEVHLIEPQPACLPFLESLAKEAGYILHSVALGAQDGQMLELAIDPVAVTTGAHIAIAGADNGKTVTVPTATLDSLFAQRLQAEDCVLLKLDLQGWEQQALEGASTITLPLIEAVLIEVSFFPQAYEPPIASLMRFFDQSGFDIHDVASLSARCRDNRARQADFVFVNRRSSLAADTAWE